MNHAAKQRGFTIIELMLAMGFVSALLLAIAMTVIQIGNIYNRGLTYKDVNQSGSSIVSELKRSVAESTPFVLSDKFVDKTWGGRLCTGQYSYVWNYGSAISSLNANRNVYAAANPSPNQEIRLVKVIDPNSSYCTDSSKKIVNADAVELLSEGQHNLALHYFTISADIAHAGDSATGQQLYNIEFLIGTNDPLALKNSLASTACKIPGESGADPSYCSISQFDITVRAGNVSE